MKHTGKINKFTIILISLSVLLVFSAAIYYHYNEEVNLLIVSMTKQKKAADEIDTSHVNFRIVLNVGAKDFLSIKMIIPCEDEDQYYDLKRNMNGIKSDILIRIDQMEMEKLVRYRKLTEIKNNVLKIINLHTKKTVKYIYYDSLTYQ